METNAWGDELTHTQMPYLGDEDVTGASSKRHAARGQWLTPPHPPADGAVMPWMAVGAGPHYYPSAALAAANAANGAHAEAADGGPPLACASATQSR